MPTPPNTRPGAGVVVSDVMALVLLLLAVAGVILDRPLLAMLGAVMLALTVLGRLWARLALEGVRYRLEVMPERAVAGDRLTLSVTLENHKSIPVPWVRVHEPLPPGLELIDTRGRHQGAFGTTWLSATTSLRPRERVRLSYRLRARARGHYVLGPGRLTGSDPFGLYESERVVVRTGASLIVYPALPATGPALPWPARPLGDHRARLHLVDDPGRPMTVREYRHGDSARSIDWKVSARRGAPWVRVNEASASTTVLLLVECDTRRRGAFDHALEPLEQVVCAAGALARDLLQAGVPVGLVANGVPPGDRARVAVAPGSGPGQLVQVLEALARVQPLVVKPMSALLAEYGARVLPAGATLVAVSATLQADTAGCLTSRARGGERTALVHVGVAPAPALPGVPAIVWQPQAADESTAPAGEEQAA